MCGVNFGGYSRVVVCVVVRDCGILENEENVMEEVGIFVEKIDW